MTRLSRALAVLGALLALAACGSTPVQERPTEYLDEHTAATVTIVDKPIVFARERPELAANVRDYVTLSAASVNRSGQMTYVLVGYFWSTLDAFGAPRIAAANDPLLLAADDRRIHLSTQGHSAKEAGIANPVHAPPQHDGPPTVYSTDLDTLRFLAAARDLTAVRGVDANAQKFEIWDDGRASLGAFVRFINGE
jgi:hypothetical protein